MLSLPGVGRVIRTGFLCLLILCAPFVGITRAGTLFPVSIGLSSHDVGAAGVTATVSFTTATTNNLQEIRIRFSTTSGGTTKPAHLDLSGVSLSTLTGLSAGWSLDTSAASGGLLKLEIATPENVAASTAVTATLDGIGNSAIDDCEPAANGLQDTCYLTVTTFADTTGTSDIDTGETTYTVTELPSLTFEVEGVASGQTHNGITTTGDSSATSLPFGRLSNGQIRYLAQKLTVTTNAPSGYTVKAYLVANLQGSYAGGEIDPFAATNATWGTPQSWSSPDGTTPNNNTGWLGANTSDTRVAGWAGASAKFGPFGMAAHDVMYSSTEERSGASAYVSYAIEVNGMQPADEYVGTLIYDVQPTY